MIHDNRQSKLPDNTDSSSRNPAYALWKTTQPECRQLKKCYGMSFGREYSGSHNSHYSRITEISSFRADHFRIRNANAPIAAALANAVRPL